MTQTTAHIINHTHWDREWFLTATYTSRWIPQLIERIETLAAANRDFRYLFDGQTLVLEDLAAVAPEYVPRAEALIGAGSLTVGPYYCQPDWQLTDGELLIRNLIIGQQDTRRHGGAMRTGWLVDTFGHISQAPQIHRLFGIDAVYVWRGVPQMTPYFRWQGADGSELLAVDLFGGYRNLYGVSHAPEVAVTRLHAELDKLRPYYPTADIPLFDGYDLEDDPEDPLRFFAAAEGIDPAITLRETTPAAFVQHVRARQLSLPVITGELNSGKYGATFPGTFSARTYLKVMAHDCAHLLFRFAEPLATLAWCAGRPYATERYESWARLLLQNAVHDCICGVSIDQVHEKMEDIYRRVFDDARADVEESLAAILGDFAPGLYAAGTTPFAVDQWQPAGGELVHVQTDGVGVFAITDRVPIARTDEAVEGFTWQNAHYAAHVTSRGEVTVDGHELGRLTVWEECGDTYSDESGALLGTLLATSVPVLVERSAHHAVLAFDAAWQSVDRSATAQVRLTFDASPLLRWAIELDSQGANLRVEMAFATGGPGAIHAGMPFDVVTRPVADNDLLPRAVEGDLARILLGQREVNEVRTFPFHEFVAVGDARRCVAVLAKGLHAYRAGEAGTLHLTLRRAVEWLTAADLANRVGDAGPFFYVPDARCERRVRHEIAVAFCPFAADSMEMQAINAAYQSPPLLVEAGGHGTRTQWAFLRADTPLSALQVAPAGLHARLYNPTPDAVSLSDPLARSDVWGEAAPGRIESVPPHAIVDVLLPAPPQPASRPAPLVVHDGPAWRVGTNRSRPDPAVLAELEQRMAALTAQLAELAPAAPNRSTADRLRREHHRYVLERELAELRLSLLLNERKLAEGETPSHAYLYDPDDEIAAAGLALNRLRIKRRIFDYVVAALES